MDSLDSSPHLPHESRKRAHTSSPSPPRESCPSIEEEQSVTASSPVRMIKKRKTLKRRETAFERMNDVSIGMEAEEGIDVATEPLEKGEESAIADSGRAGSPVTVHLPIALETPSGPSPMVQLSPIERRTQTFNIHGRSRSASPQTQDASAVFQGPMLLHEVMETSVYVADGVESSDQILVNVGLPENGDLTSDGESRREPVSAVVQAFANPFVYQTPIRSRTNVSSGTIIQATPIDVHSFLPRGTIPSRQPPITQNSVSPTARMTHLGRSATSMLSGSPSLPSPSGYTLSLPHQSRRSSVSVRGGTDSRREERSVAYRRTSDNAENEPIAQDLYDASTGISSPSSRPHPGQLDEALEQWQRNPESPLQSRQVTSPTNASSRTGSRWNYPYYPRYSPRTSTNDSVAHIDHSPIRAELPGPTNSRTASWQSLHSTNAVNGLSSRSQAVLADIGNDPFTTSYRSNLMRNASIESSLMAAQDEDEDDRDFMMSSSPPAQCADGEENEGAARLVADIVQCQLESGVSVDEAVEAVEASAAFFDGYGDRLAAQSSGRGLDSMFRPYSMTQITHAELTGAAIQG